MGNSVTARRLAAALLLLVPLLTPLQGFGAGLGRLTVLSALGQPLSAEIEIVSLQAGEEDSLSARFAPPEAYRQAGIEFNSVLLGVRFAIDRRDGKPIVKLVSNAPVGEPFLNVLVELSWNTGRLVREYTFLLDPPEYKGVQPIAPAPAPLARPLPAPAAATPRPVEAPRHVEARPLAAAPAKATKGTYAVKKGDTLAKIATQSMPAGVTLQQMLIALYRANPDAFIAGNVNLLRGPILNLPDADAAAAIDQAEARRLVAAQAQDFRAYQSRLAGAVAAAPAESSAARQSSAGKITATADQPGEDKKDQLKLSKADPESKGAHASAARADNAASSQKGLQESQSRVAELEKNVQDLQKLLELKNQSLAEWEKKAAAKPVASAPAPVPAAPAPEAPKAAPPAPVIPAVEPPKPVEAAKAPEAPTPAAEPPKAPTPPPAPKPKPAPPPPPLPSLVDEFLENPLALGSLVGVLFLLVGYVYWAWRRKKATQSKFQDSVMGAPPAASLGTSSVFSGAGGSDVDTGAAVSQASVSDVNVAIADADEVDPIAEADRYMAYGRDTQSEEILKDALGKDTERLALHGKLAEIYAGRGDGQNLEQSMMKVKDITGGQGADWNRLVAVARASDPTNALYGGDVEATVMIRPAAAPAASAAPTLDFDLDSSAPGAASADITLDSEAPAAAGPAAVDFDLNAGEAPAAASAEEKTDFTPGGTIIMDAGDLQSASGGLDFDLGMGDAEKPAEPAPAAAPESPAKSWSGGLDFNLDLDSDFDKTVMIPAAKPEMDLSDISFDLGAFDAAASAGESDPRWQEVATKLDLAKAYEEMGDKDGARDLLNEVAKEGDEAQQNQARKMLAKLD